MNLEEIVNRSDREVFTQEEMSFVVEGYIRERKGKSVKVNISMGVFAIVELEMLSCAFTVAKVWFKENKFNK